MSKKRIAIVFCIFLFIAVGFIISKFFSTTKIVNAKISGRYFGNQVWGGNIIVTGDTDILGNLTVLPGTIIEVNAFSDDQHGGIDRPHDPPFPKDPDRKETQSTIIIINGTLNAVGTVDKRIIFTSDKKQTTYDWDGLYIARGRLEYAIVEHARYNSLQESSDVVIANTIFRNSLEDCLGIGHNKPVSPQILNNEFYNCGHEGIDIGGGSPVIRGNYFHVENPEIQPDSSIGRSGVVVYQYSYPVIENNRFEKLKTAIVFLQDSRNNKEGDKKVIIRDNIIKNNEAVFETEPGFPMDSVIKENNQFVGNIREEVRE